MARPGEKARKIIGTDVDIVVSARHDKAHAAAAVEGNGHVTTPYDS